MRAVLQRVKSAAVRVDGKLISAIDRGLLIFVGIAENDQQSELDYLAKKIANLRIFEDNQKRMNRSLIDVAGEALVISQFTLYGDCRKGRRPSFTAAASPHRASQLYEEFVKRLENERVSVKTGVFQATMEVESINDGPVTLILDSSKIL